MPNAKIGFKYIAPARNPFRFEPYIEEVKDAVDETADEMKLDFQDVVSDWKTRVDFRKLTTVNPDVISARIIAVGSGAKIWGYVDQGTKPHIIRAKSKKKPLKFRTGYSARTRGGKAHVGTGKASGPWRSVALPNFVNHPGNEPRDFTKTITDKFAPTFRQAINRAIKLAKNK